MAKRYSKKRLNFSFATVLFFVALYLAGMILEVLVELPITLTPRLLSDHTVVIGLFFYLLLFFSSFSLVGVLVASLTSIITGAVVASAVISAFRAFTLLACLQLLPLICLLAPTFVLYSARCAASSMLLIQKMVQLSSDHQLAAAIRKQLLASIPTFVIVLLTAILYQRLFAP